MSVVTGDALKTAISVALPRATDVERAEALAVATALLPRLRQGLTGTEAGSLNQALAVEEDADLGLILMRVVDAVTGPALNEFAARDVIQGAQGVLVAIRERLQYEAADVLTRVLLPYFAAPGVSNARAKPAALLREWSHAFAVASRRIRSVLDAIRELIDRVEADRPLFPTIVADFDPRSTIATLQLGAGDTHHAGRAVAIISFTDGSTVVYKPRPLASDVAFARLLEWVHMHLGTRLGATRTLDRETYGYVAFVETANTTHDPVQQCESLGALLAILHALRACDMHFENIVLSADGPIVIDAETLLTPVINEAPGYADGSASQAAARRIAESVLGIGLLPTLIGDASDNQAFDVGFLGYRAGQRSPFKSVTVSLGTGESLQYVTASADTPTVVLEALPAYVRRDSVHAGFDAMTRAIARQADAFLDAVVRCFDGADVRVVPVATANYRQLLTMSYHPDALADPVLRAAVLARVVLRDGRPGSVELAMAESIQLARGDVPAFSCAVTGVELIVHTDEDDITLPFTGRSPLQHVAEAVACLDADRIAQQRFIDLAFVNSLDTADDSTDGLSASASATAKVNVSASVRGILDRLVASVVRGKSSQFPATWIDPSVTVPDQSQWRPGSLGYDLYGGAPGMAMVLAAGATAFADDSYAKVASAVLRPLAAQFASGSLDAAAPAAGGLSGAGSTGYALALASRLLGTEYLPMDRPAVMRTLSRAADDPRQPWDFVSGVVGALAAGIAMGVEADTEESVTRIADRVLTVLDDVDWSTAYTGYAHGAAGAAAVLFRAGIACNDDRLRRRGIDLIDRVQGVIRRGRLPRTFVVGDPEASIAWCHGSTGVLLALTQIHQVDRQAVGIHELSALAQEVYDGGFGNNPTMCHGDAGSLDVLLSLAIETPELVLAGRPVAALIPELTDAVVLAADRARLGRRNRYGFVNSVMVGAAGTAWAAMRTSHPQIVPSVLGLADLPPTWAVEQWKKKAG